MVQDDDDYDNYDIYDGVNDEDDTDDYDSYGDDGDDDDYYNNYDDNDWMIMTMCSPRRPQRSPDRTGWTAPGLHRGGRSLHSTTLYCTALY